MYRSRWLTKRKGKYDFRFRNYHTRVFMLSLQTVRKEDHDLLYNINQKYLYEMTNYYDDPMDANGNFHYG